MSDNQKIIPINIEDQMKTAYIDYSMSVIVSRALPDVRDGLKPVHRRVLYGMYELGVGYNKAHKKSARIVGEVLGKYHPHGDSSVYDTMVRMAQDWSLRYPLVDGQGNFGSMDGDSPAAMRYTEARLKRITDEMLGDLEKDTVDYKLNFDDTLEEPTVMPTKLPNLLINGSSGIAVGMATNMMPHNLTEVVDAIVAHVDNPDMTTADLMQYVKAPDFPTGGIIYGMEGVREGFETGRGRVVVRGRAEIETSSSGKETIIITEIPYQVNKAMLVAKIAELVNEKKIVGISDIRDESDRNGLRIVVEIRRDSMATVVLSNLYKYTALQTSYGINNVCLVNGRPRTLGLKDLIKEFIKFRLEVIVRRTKFELKKAEDRAHILEGFLVALDDMDRIITMIRASKTVDDAMEALTSATFKLSDNTAEVIGVLTEEGAISKIYNLSDIQAKSILEMRLQRLTGLERDKVFNEYVEIKKLIEHLKAILASEELQRGIVKEELTEIKTKFGDERRTEISFADGEISIEDMMADDEMVITISHLGYIKRTNSAEYRTQSRGGRGSKGAKTRDADFVEQIFVATNHDYLLFFTEQGKCHWLQVYQIPEASKTSSGRVVQNILNMPMDDKIRAYIRIDKDDFKSREFVENHYIIFCTSKGLIKKTSMADYARPRNGGILAISINDGDSLLEAKLTNGNNEIVIVARAGKAIRFNEKNVRPMGRTATGVRAITLNTSGIEDHVVGMVCVDMEDTGASIFVLSEKGVGKRSAVEDYPTVGRGGKGVKTIQVTDKTGYLVAVKSVKDEDDLMVTCKSGIIIRIACADFRVMGRATQGVRVIKLDSGDEIADVAVVLHENEEEETVIVDGEATDVTNISGETTSETTDTASEVDDTTEE
jgi:DNA gyrase subunit A